MIARFRGRTASLETFFRTDAVRLAHRISLLARQTRNVGNLKLTHEQRKASDVYT